MHFQSVTNSSEATTQTLRVAAVPTRKPRICFVAPAAWPVLSGATDIPVVGGAEVQQSLLARGLAATGYDVSMVCLDYGQPEQAVVDGVTVFKAFRPDEGLPGLRYIYPRLTQMLGALRRADADLYYQRSTAMLTGVVAWFCSRNRRKSVYAAASDIDFLPGKQQIDYRRDRWLFEFGLRNVDEIVVQNQRQQADCLDNYHRNATLIPSCCRPVAAPRDPNEILWVGTIRSYKRPEIFLNLARCLPQFCFTMVGGPGGSDSSSINYFRAIEAAAKSIPNLRFHGFVPYSEVDSYFDRARVFVNTSLYEGFPNTFLQSWARGVPVVSYFDTGSRHNKDAVVRVVADEPAAAIQISTLMSNARDWRTASQRSLEHFSDVHSVDSAVSRYARLFSRMGIVPALA